MGDVELGLVVGLAEGLELDVQVGVIDGETQEYFQPVGRARDCPLDL